MKIAVPTVNKDIISDVKGVSNNSEPITGLQYEGEISPSFYTQKK
jgi:hypothetical protein